MPFHEDLSGIWPGRMTQSVTPSSISLQRVHSKIVPTNSSRTLSKPGRIVAAFIAVAMSAGALVAGTVNPTGAAATRSGTKWLPADNALPAHWLPLQHIPAVVDLAGPRQDRSLILAMAGRLSLLGPSGLVGFARGKDGYATVRGTEPYVALAPGTPVAGTRCSFSKGDIYALDPGRDPAVIRIDVGGRTKRFAGLPRGSFPNGIAFDTTGRFDHRLLVSVAADRATSILSIDCRGAARTLTRRAPRVEGGIVVAPSSFGTFAGDLIAPDEISGTIYAIGPGGTARIVAKSRLPHGGDIGVESEGFVPAGLSPGSAAYLADRSVPGNPHPGTDTVLELTGADLIRAKVKSGDLLVATEGGAETIAVGCRQTCRVRHIAAGPTATHAEGHIVFTPIALPSARQSMHQKHVRTIP
jgi:hypothetical protein